MKLSVTAGFLWLPINRTSPVEKLHFLSEGVKFREIDISLDPVHPEYYAAMDLTAHVGDVIEVCGSLPDRMLSALHFHDTQPDTGYSGRPLIHFTALVISGSRAYFLAALVAFGLTGFGAVWRRFDQRKAAARLGIVLLAAVCTVFAAVMLPTRCRAVCFSR